MQLYYLQLLVPVLYIERESHNVSRVWNKTPFEGWQANLKPTTPTLYVYYSRSNVCKEYWNEIQKVWQGVTSFGKLSRYKLEGSILNITVGSHSVELNTITNHRKRLKSPLKGSKQYTMGQVTSWKLPLPSHWGIHMQYSYDYRCECGESSIVSWYL